MSTSLEFFRPSRIERGVPAVVNIDHGEPDFAYVAVDRAAEWERQFGTLCTIEYRTTDVWAVAEELFGIRPTSCRYSQDFFMHGYDAFAEVVCSFADTDETRRISKAVLDAHAYTERYEAYAYDRKELGYVDDGYLVDYRSFENRTITRADVLEMAGRFMDEHGREDFYEHYGRALYSLMQVYFSADDGDPIVCLVC